MTRRQLRRHGAFRGVADRHVRCQCSGVGLGLFFGWGLVTALPASLAASTAIPAGNIIVLMIVAALAGVTAAWLPARRAGKLNVLEAIAH